MKKLLYFTVLTFMLIPFSVNADAKINISTSTTQTKNSAFLNESGVFCDEEKLLINSQMKNILSIS